jgi:hypothetical protein
MEALHVPTRMIPSEIGPPLRVTVTHHAVLVEVRVRGGVASVKRSVERFREALSCGRDE